MGVGEIRNVTPASPASTATVMTARLTGRDVQEGRGVDDEHARRGIDQGPHRSEPSHRGQQDRCMSVAGPAQRGRPGYKGRKATTITAVATQVTAVVSGSNIGWKTSAMRYTSHK